MMFLMQFCLNWMLKKIVDQHEHETMEKCDISDQVLSQLDVDKIVKESGFNLVNCCQQTM